MRRWLRSERVIMGMLKNKGGCALLVKKQFLDEVGRFKDVPTPNTYLHQEALKRELRFRFIRDTKACHCRKLTLQRIIHTQIEHRKRRRKHKTLRSIRLLNQ